MPHAQRRRSPFAPSFTPVAVAVVGLAAVSVPVVMDVVDGDARAWALVALARTAALVLAGTAVRRRRDRDDPERPLWRALGLGLLVLGTGSALDLVARSLLGPGPELALPLALLVAVPVVHAGLLRWNRTRPDLVVTSDRLDALGAVLAVVALLHLLVSAVPAVPVVPGPALELDLLGVSLVAVLLATAVRTGRGHGCSRDVRVWLVVLPTAAVLVVRTLGLLTAADGPWWLVPAAWVLLAVGTAVASGLPRRPARALPAAPRDVVVPVFAGLGVAVAVLVVDGAVDGRRGAGWAAAAVVVLSVRVVRVLRALLAQARRRVETTRDDLTGLVTRSALRVATDRLVSGSGGAPVCLLVLDLDDFQTVNDRFGHRTGDLVLAAFARRLAQTTPAEGVLARMGGDEFAVLLPGGVEGAAAVADRFLALCRAGVDVEAQHLDLWASVGIAVSGGHDPELSGEELARRADIAMWAAKVRGGGLSVYDDEAARADHDRALLAHELVAALGRDAPAAGRDRFEVVYQPQVSTSTDEVVGVEALVRWNHPDLGVLLPQDFLDIVEERGLMRSLTAHVVRTATADLRAWARGGLRLRLSVNTSASCLTTPLLMDLLEEVVAAGTDPRQLVVEVTETTLMAEPQRALEVCHAMTARGVGLSIDDYGTGYSSLAYLADLPVTELKIDRSFTSRVGSDPRIAAIVAGTVELAHHLGLRAVAEGVEDRRTLARLRALGCDESQGFWHSPALPAADLLLWLRARPRDRAAVPLA